jgi:hypothetical protein
MLENDGSRRNKDAEERQQAGDLSAKASIGRADATRHHSQAQMRTGQTMDSALRRRGGSRGADRRAQGKR